MKTSKLTISLIVLCSVLAVANVAFFIYFFNQSPQEPKEPIIIQKGNDEQLTEEDIKQAMSQAVNEVREDATANETAYMGFMLTFIGTMATIAGIAFTVYNFFQVSKVRDSVEQGIKDGLDRLGAEYEKKIEEKYSNRIIKLEQFNEAFSKVISKMAFVETKIKKPNAIIYLFKSLMSYYAEKDYLMSIRNFELFISENREFEGYLNISLYKLYDNCGLIEMHTDDVLEILIKCFDKSCYVKSSSVYKYFNEVQLNKLHKAMDRFDGCLTAMEKEMYIGICEPWEELFEKIS